jgi:hypothetical protein
LFRILVWTTLLQICLSKYVVKVSRRQRKQSKRLEVNELKEVTSRNTRHKNSLKFRVNICIRRTVMDRTGQTQ